MSFFPFQIGAFQIGSSPKTMPQHRWSPWSLECPNTESPQSWTRWTRPLVPRKPLDLASIIWSADASETEAKISAWVCYCYYDPYHQYPTIIYTCIYNIYIYIYICKNNTMSCLLLFFFFFCFLGGIKSPWLVLMMGHLFQLHKLGYSPHIPTKDCETRMVQLLDYKRSGNFGNKKNPLDAMSTWNDRFNFWTYVNFNVNLFGIPIIFPPVFPQLSYCWLYIKSAIKYHKIPMTYP